MASTTFVDGETLIEASWLNDVNAVVYTPGTSTAADIANVPAGNIAATDVQAAINELDTEKQPMDNELTALATSTAAANKIPYFTSGTTAGTLDWNAASTLANSATTISSNTVVKAAVDAMAIGTQVAPGTSGNLLTSNGSAWTSAADKAIGVGQTWTDVKTSPGRAKGSTYTNSSGRPIQVLITQADGANGIAFQVGGVTIAAAGSGATTANHIISAVIPNGATYGLTNTGGAVAYWYELI